MLALNDVNPLEKEKTKTLIVVVGPTGIGKTKLAIDLAQHYQTEIISADSRQFFKEMTIGTAVPSAEELEAAPHHFIQHTTIFEPYSVGDFESDALSLLDNLFQKQDVVIMAGGSGLYIKAVVEGLDAFPEVDAQYRETLNDELSTSGLAPLQDELRKVDPKYAAVADMDNPHRVIRALEICRATGKTFSSFLGKPKPQRSFKTQYIGITADRELIYDRINRRVDLMMEMGQLKEAEGLFAHKALNALQTVGYQELFNYFEGKWTLEFAIAEIKKNSRRYAKRQLTWLRKNEAIHWVEFDNALEMALNHLQ
ncbi:tRNA (adenosine(37)-N6)-dimethylallyltransferase MiaA [Sediminicola luteus]|uniref:tRNA dimethylallyltransferase n=1 Tax=Sediminicola luteus TaxID=319238 RepID=A0A2A4G3Z3_9FLAO|nr:tRNA (adenosine(37)-N6)-dimethylallyltransferase MiaA [Sediminicola luteus]PCE63679.1 tRNA (adenosine(37)-N6)-dimethylallyltransferase MiaA [Sediminicola luteus]